MVLRRAAVYGSQSGSAAVRGLPVRANAIQASCICSESRSTGEPTGHQFRAPPGRRSVPKTNGVFTSWPAPSLPPQPGDFQVKR